MGLALALSAAQAASASATPGPISLGAYLAEITAARQRVFACAGAAKACGADGLPGDQQVSRGAAGAFRVSWQWLANTLTGTASLSRVDRERTMRRADAHLLQLAEEAQGDAGTAELASFAVSRAAAQRVLARPEFRAASGPGWWARHLARLQDWILRLLSGMGRVGSRLPWLAAAIEWSCFGLAATGLLWFLWRNLTRQALQVSLSEAGPLAGWSERDAADWRQMADGQAAAGAWREATHSLYWAGVALLESRRAWRPNSTRTPREYLPLLKPGSEAQRALEVLTHSLEAAWYGQAATDETQFRAAQQSFQQLERARPERAPSERSAGSVSREGTSLPAAEGA